MVTEGTNRQHLGVGLRGVRSRPGGTARGCAPWATATSRRAARRPRPEPTTCTTRDVRGRLLRPPGHGGVGPVGRQRRHRERAELAPPDVPDPATATGSTFAGSTFSTTGRSSTFAAGCSPVSCRAATRPGDPARGSAARRHGASARGGAGDHDRGRELVRADRAALRPRRHGDQLRGRRLPGLRGDHLVPVDQSDPGGGVICLQVQTRQSTHLRRRRRLAPRRAGRGGPVSDPRVIEEPGFVAQSWRAELHQGEALTVEKVVASTSRDPAISEAGLAARDGPTTWATSPSCWNPTRRGTRCGGASTCHSR